MNRTTQLALTMASILTLAGACSKDEKAAETKTTQPAAEAKAPSKTTPDQAAKAAEPDQAVKAAEPVTELTMAALLSNYEAIRTSLANDSANGVTALAKSVADAATALADSAEEANTPMLKSLAAEAVKLAALSEDDIAATRLAFGDVSRSLIALVKADSELADGLHIFECPMAKGYKLWIQPDPELENPYMGQKMLTCGSEVTGE